MEPIKYMGCGDCENLSRSITVVMNQNFLFVMWGNMCTHILKTCKNMCMHIYHLDMPVCLGSHYYNVEDIIGSCFY